MKLIVKLWVMLIDRGSEIDDPSQDELYLTIEQAIILYVRLENGLITEAELNTFKEILNKLKIT